MPEKQAIDFQKYIDRLEQDRREMEKRLTDDAREREQRSLEHEQRSREERKALEKRNLESEQRNREELKALEKRNLESEQRSREERKALEERAVKMEERLNANAERIENKIDSFVAETKESLREAKVANRWFIGLNIAVIIGATTIIIAFVNLLVNGS